MMQYRTSQNRDRCTNSRSLNSEGSGLSRYAAWVNAHNPASSGPVPVSGEGTVIAERRLPPGHWHATAAHGWYRSRPAPPHRRTHSQPEPGRRSVPRHDTNVPGAYPPTAAPIRPQHRSLLLRVPATAAA